MPDIDDMTLEQIKAKIERMGWEIETEPQFEDGVSLTIRSWDGFFEETFIAMGIGAELDAARAALRWLRERKRK